MKYILFIGLFILVIAIPSAHSQSTAKKATKAVGKTAKAVGNRTAEIAVKGGSGVVDKVYRGKTGPGGQTIYINKNSKYYWVDKKGHRVYIKKSKLLTKS